MEIIWDHPGEPSVITRVLKCGKEGGQSDAMWKPNPWLLASKREKENHSGAKTCDKPEAIKDFPSECSERNAVLLTP